MAAGLVSVGDRGATVTRGVAVESSGLARSRAVGAGCVEKPPLKPLSLTIFFPCYNEEANVERVTRLAREVAAGVTPDFEILIVNDGSRF